MGKTESSLWGNVKSLRGLSQIYLDRTSQQQDMDLSGRGLFLALAMGLSSSLGCITLISPLRTKALSPPAALDA